MPPQDQHPFIIGDTFYPAFMSALEYKVTKVLCIVEGPTLENETCIKDKRLLNRETSLSWRLE